MFPRVGDQVECWGFPGYYRGYIFMLQARHGTGMASRLRIESGFDENNLILP